jgi:hypothetical protein
MRVQCSHRSMFFLTMMELLTVWRNQSESINLEECHSGLFSQESRYSYWLSDREDRCLLRCASDQTNRQMQRNPLFLKQLAGVYKKGDIGNNVRSQMQPAKKLSCRKHRLCPNESRLLYRSRWAQNVCMLCLLVCLNRKVLCCMCSTVTLNW